MVATRPVFIPTDFGSPLVEIKHVEFEWFPGFSVSQKRKSVDALHAAASENFALKNILEISSKSESDFGVSLSAFNLLIETRKYGRSFSVESAYQASKVFEYGGPFIDLLDKESAQAKKDPRLRKSGRLTKFVFYRQEWPLEPKSLFYDWLYINALKSNSTSVRDLHNFNAFTDIEFNPNKSVSCQAHSAALYISLIRRDLLSKALASPESYIDVVTSFKIGAQTHVVQQQLI